MLMEDQGNGSVRPSILREFDENKSSSELRLGLRDVLVFPVDHNKVIV
jgi:hypothetical protein